MVKKLLTIAFVLGLSLNAFSQKAYTIKKIGTVGFKSKVEGTVTVSDSTVSIKINYGGKPSETVLKIVNRSEQDLVSSYQCTGVSGTADKHVISVLLPTKTIIWKAISSFDGSQAEQHITIE
jgi:hypothetical protein